MVSRCFTEAEVAVKGPIVREPGGGPEGRRVPGRLGRPLGREGGREHFCSPKDAGRRPAWMALRKGETPS